MAYKKKADLNTDKTIALGGVDKKTGKPNPTKIEGYYLGAKVFEGAHGEGKLHIFQTSSGNVGIYGKTNSNRLLTSEHVGQMCLLTFTGMGKAQKGKQAPYNYELQYDADNTVEVAGDESAAESFGSDNSYADDGVEDDADLDAEEQAVDEAPPVRASAPRAPASVPSKTRVQDLLNRKNRVA